MNSTENKVVHYFLGAAPANIIMIGDVFLIVGVSLLIILSWFSVLFLVVGILIFMMKDFLAVDYENNQLMKYVKIFKFRLGKWERMKNVRYIALVRVKTYQKINMLTISSETTSIDVKANMVFDGNQYLTLFKMKKSKAMPIVEDMAIWLNVDIHDLTMRKKLLISPCSIKVNAVDG